MFSFKYIFDMDLRRNDRDLFETINSVDYFGKV